MPHFWLRNSESRTVLLFISAFMFAYFSVAGVRGYMIAFLEYLQHSPTTIGMIASIMAAAGIIGQSVVGYLCDKKGAVKPFFFITLAIVAVASFAVFALTPTNILLLVVFFAIVGSSQGTCLALSDSWILESKDGLRSYYGTIRGAGSVGWSLGLLSYGLAVAAFGFEAIPFLGLVTAIIAFSLGRRLPDVHKATSSTPINIGTLMELAHNYRYVYLVVTVLLTAFVIQADWVLNSMKSAQLGTPASLGLFLFVQASSEVPFFLIFKRLQNRIDVSKLFAFGMFVYIVRIGLMRIAPDITTMTFIAITNSISFAPVHISSRLLFDSQSPSHLKTAGQLIANAICVGIGGITAPLIFGSIIATIGLNQASYILMAVALIPLMMAIIYIKLHKKTQGDINDV